MSGKKILLLLLSGFYFAAFTQGNPDIRKMIKNAGDQKDYPGKHELIIFDSTKVDVEESGLSHVHVHQLTKVLDDKGAAENAVYQIGYDPLSAFIEIEDITIYRKSGETEKLDMQNVLDYPAPARAIYWGAREKMIGLGRLEPGDAFEVKLYRKGFTYALLHDGSDDERYIPPMRGHFYEIVEFWSEQPVLEKVYSVSIPDDKLVQYEVYNGEVKVSAKPAGEKFVFTFSKSDYSEPAREPNMVAKSDEFTKLLISTSPDWYAKSVWFYKVNEDFGSFESTLEIDRKVAEILEGAENEMDSVALLTHWVADNIRYSGISMGEGEGYTLHKGEMTFSDRCGVCKDKAGMLITMLRAAGFESYAAMTMAGSRIDRIPADQFNHSVTVVKLSDGKYHVLDPTWVPFVRELWSSLEQQQNYLMGLPEGADLMITPVSDPSNHYLRITGNSELIRNGTLNGNFTLEAEGQSDAAIRRLFTSGYVSEWKNSLKEEILRVHPRAEIHEMDFGNPYDYQSAPLKIVINYSIPEYAIITDEEIIFTPFVVSGIFKRAMSHLYLDTSVKDRKYQFRDRCSREVELSETVTLPFNVLAKHLPPAEMFGSEAASFKGMVMADGSTLTVSENITLEKRIYDPDEWEPVKRAVVAQKKFSDEPVILRVAD